jgi:two-component system NtrC family sensor kinase
MRVREHLSPRALVKTGQRGGSREKVSRRSGEVLLQGLSPKNSAPAVAAAYKRAIEELRSEGDWAHRRAEDLMELALDATRSRGIPEFLEKFTARAARLMNADGAAVAIFRAAQIESLVTHGRLAAGDAQNGALRRGLEAAVAGNSEEIRTARPAALFGREAARALGLGHANVTLARFDGGDSAPLGIVCLLRREPELSLEDRKLLRALVSHASLTLENFRRFSQIERSRKQWVEDIDAISDYMVVHDRNWRIVRMNRSLASHIGAPPSALVGQPMSRLRSIANSPAGLPCPFCREIERSHEEYVQASKKRLFLVSTSRIGAANEDELRTIHVLKDITDRREAERRYRDLFDSIQEGLFFATPDGRFLDVNDALVRMLGYASREELLQTDARDHLYLAPDSRERFLRTLELRGVLRNYEEPLRRKDGSILYTLQNITAVRDAQGRIAQIRGLMLDVTEQKTFQAQLQRERDFNKRILNATQSMILVLDTAGLISYANRRCFEAGYREKALIGGRMVDWVNLPRRKDFEAALETTANGQQVDNLELPFRRSDGSTGHFSVSLSPMRDEQNTVNSIVVVMTDITDAAILQAKLAHAEKMATIGQLVSGVAHEVNNPLAAILGFTDLLLEEPGVPGSAKTELEIILQEAQRTKDIVQDLLSFARQRPARRELVQVNAVLRQTLKLRSYDFSSHGVDVSESLEENLPAVMGDAQQLQQVFLNILNNAYDAVQETQRRGRIQIHTTQQNGSVEVTFTDNGTGISEPDRIFDPFFTTKGVGRGTGLGLSICYGIVRAHGGEIQCWNRAPGEGSAFRVRLPAASEAAAAATEGQR